MLRRHVALYCLHVSGLTAWTCAATLRSCLGLPTATITQELPLSTGSLFHSCWRARQAACCLFLHVMWDGGVNAGSRVV